MLSTKKPGRLLKLESANWRENLFSFFLSEDDEQKDSIWEKEPRAMLSFTD